MVEMVLQRILISETSDQQYIFLKEKDGERAFPIVIGFPEAQAIDRFVKGEHFPRPLTHDLLAGVITALGGTVAKVEITNLKEGTFYAVIHIDGPDGRKVEVDARPSDAIAIATAAKAPILVAEQVIEESATA